MNISFMEKVGLAPNQRFLQQRDRSSLFMGVRNWLVGCFGPAGVALSI